MLFTIRLSRSTCTLLALVPRPEHLQLTSDKVLASVVTSAFVQWARSTCSCPREGRPEPRGKTSAKAQGRPALGAERRARYSVHALRHGVDTAQHGAGAGEEMQQRPPALLDNHTDWRKVVGKGDDGREHVPLLLRREVLRGAVLVCVNHTAAQSLELGGNQLQVGVSAAASMPASWLTHLQEVLEGSRHLLPLCYAHHPVQRVHQTCRKTGERTSSHRPLTHSAPGKGGPKLSCLITWLVLMCCSSGIICRADAPQQGAKDRTQCHHTWRAMSSVCECIEMWNAPATLGTGSLHSSWHPSRPRRPSCKSFIVSGEVSCSRPPRRKNWCASAASQNRQAERACGTHLRRAAEEREQVVLAGWACVQAYGAPVLVQAHL